MRYPFGDISCPSHLIWPAAQAEGGPEEELVRLRNSINAVRSLVTARGDAAVDLARAAVRRGDLRAATAQWEAARAHYVRAGVCTASAAFGQSRARRYDTEDLPQVYVGGRVQRLVRGGGPT